MNLTRKLLIFLLLEIVIFLIVSGSVVFYILFPDYKSFEENAASTSMQQVVKSLEREADHLHTFTLDWSAWDEMAEFTLSHSPSFEEKTFTHEDRVMYKLDLIGVFDFKRNLISFETENTFNGRDIRSKIVDGSNKLIQTLSVKSDASGEGAYGIFWVDNVPILLSIRPITNNTFNTASYGYLLLGRAIDKSLMNDLIEQSGIPFKIFHTARSSDSNKMTIKVDPKFQDTLVITKSLSDIFGNPSTTVQASIKRTIMQKGNESIRYFVLITLGLGVIFLIFSLMFMRFLILNPIKKLKKQMQWIIDHETFETIKRKTKLPDEFTELTDQFNRLIGYAKTQHEQLEQLTRIDPLTLLYNRRAMDEYLISQTALLYRQKKPLSLIMLDIDHFKLYNDTYGHIEGDRVIKSVAEVIQKSVRRSSDFVSRFGGEEFVIILPYTSLEDSQKIAEMIRKGVLDLNIEHSTSTTADHVTVSIGITSHIPHTDNLPSILLHEADNALYTAKESGRNRVIIYSD